MRSSISPSWAPGALRVNQQRTCLCSPTGGKQLAKQDDKVVGFDIHKMRVPASRGTKVVPLPHPFIGKMNDKLSKDVKIAGKNAATKGSKAKHDSGNHMQLPGTIRFEKGCKKTGEVTNGTAPKVKINGKEAATIGSQLTTCNDMGQKNNSTIIAVGAAVPMPTIINPENMAEYEQERAKLETKSPEFTTVKWSKTKAKEGEELELSAAVKDIDDGNMVTLQVFRDGQDPAVHVALAQIPTTVDGGKATGKWTYGTSGNEIPPDSDPAFFFSAHSAWCPMKKSGNVTVELKRPEITKAEWKDSEDSSTSKGLVGEVLKLSAETKDVESGVTFTVYNKATGEEVTSIGADVEGDKAEAEWTYHYKHDPENPLKEKPKFYFTVTAAKAKELKSGDVEIGQKVSIQIVSMEGMILENVTGLFINGSEEIELSGDKGLYEQEDCVPGNWVFKVKKVPEKIDGNDKYSDDGEERVVVRKNLLELLGDGIQCDADKKQMVLVETEWGYSI